MSNRISQRPDTQDIAGAPDRPGCLFIISAPSGAGKSTLCRAVLDRFPDMLYSISYTTRAPRQGERDGVHYFFITREEFEAGIERGRWAEWALVHGNYYGTCADMLNRGLKAGQDILLDIDVQGMGQIQASYPAGITIFIMPPSLEILRSRLKTRGTDSPEVIALRLKNAQQEMAQKDRYRHIIVNDQLSAATTRLIGIIENYRS